MAWICSTTSSCILAVFLGLASRCCYGFGSFGFDIHHRLSDPVKGILGVDELLPEKDSVEYYVAMAHRDRVIRARHLAANYDQSPLTFASGNDTYLFRSFRYLHYANVTVGTPSVWFLVALDTGSDLFWLPCDCNINSCFQSLLTPYIEVKLNIYSPNTSSTSQKVSCNSTFCGQTQCPSAGSSCAYQVKYLSYDTSSTGILVEDVLHLITDDDKLKTVDAPITFGCGQIQTGIFLTGAAPNGLLGLGMGDNISVPSTLARKGLSSNSFSMCFGPDGLGRIRFGDNGSSDQGETPFNLRKSLPTYNISITQITVGQNASDLNLSAIFDSGTSFTTLNDPAYTFISESFNSQVQEPRHSSDSTTPFEYCYELSPNQASYRYPFLNLTMKGGDVYIVTNPIVVFTTESGAILCLGLVRSEDVNIIGHINIFTINNENEFHLVILSLNKQVLPGSLLGKPSSGFSWPQLSLTAIMYAYLFALRNATYNIEFIDLHPENFMIGYRIVFDREKMVLGWKESNCYDDGNSSSLPISPSHSPAASPTAFNPQATGNKSPVGNHSPKLNSFTYGLVMLLVSLFVIL